MVMDRFKTGRNCVTHHCGCDCREERFRKIELALKTATVLFYTPRDTPWLIEAREALKEIKYECRTTQPHA